jgi:endonuclease/exonuclease/phosphatase family metal-dependent hydrolase
MAFTVMTWNVENLFRPGHDSGPTTDDAYRDKLQRLAATINLQAPDALSLQEIGDPGALADLVALLAGDWPGKAVGRPDGRGIRVAWLTRRPLSDPIDIIDFPAPLKPVQVDDAGTTLGVMGRGAVAVTVSTGGGTPIRLITAHLKSKLLTYPGGRFFPHDENERARYGTYALARRGGEAAALRVALTDALDGHGDDRAVILTGDLNDTPQAATTQLLLGPPGSELLTPAFDRPDKGDLTRMWNLAPLMPDDRNYSRNNQGRHELIDHILASRALLDAPKQITVGAVIDTAMPSVNPTDPNTRRNAPASDHAPIVAMFPTI